MTNGNGVSRGDRNRNARLARLRELVPLEHANQPDYPLPGTTAPFSYAGTDDGPGHRPKA